MGAHTCQVTAVSNRISSYNWCMECRAADSWSFVLQPWHRKLSTSGWTATRVQRGRQAAYETFNFLCISRPYSHGSCSWYRTATLVCHGLQGLVFNEMRAKTKVIQEPLGMNPKDYPDWSFDGSSTGQAEGNNSDCILKYDVNPKHCLPVVTCCHNISLRSCKTTLQRIGTS